MSKRWTKARPHPSPAKRSGGNCGPASEALARKNPEPLPELSLPPLSSRDNAAVTARPCVAPPKNLEEVITRLGLRTDLSPSRRRDVLSALNFIVRSTRQRAVDIPASPKAIRLLLADISPASAGVTAATLTNKRSLTLAALREAGVPTHPGRSSIALSPGWATLEAALGGKRLRNGLSRFLRYCSEQAIEPDQVDAAVFEAFRAALDDDSLVQQPSAAFRSTCRLWNEAVTAVPDWPQVPAPLPSLHRCYALPWEGFPESFRADVEEFLTRSENQDVLSDHYAPSVSPATIAMRRRQIHQLASALVLSGRPIGQVLGLADLVEPTNAQVALRYLLGRHGGQSRKYLGQQAQLLCTIARHWVKADTRTIDRLRGMSRNLTVKQRGMTKKNSGLLRQFDTAANIDALINLPARILDALGRRSVVREEDARSAMLGMAVEFLIVPPRRIGHLLGLETARHFVSHHARSRKAVHLLIPGHEVKNGVPIEMELPETTVKLLKLYRDRYLCRLAPDGSRFLFPNQIGDRRNTTRFASDIGAFVFKHTGLRMNVHLFRHLASKLHLMAHPGDHETPRRILGHKSLATTIRAYTEPTNEAAFQRYDDVIDELRRAPPKTVVRRRRLASRAGRMP